MKTILIFFLMTVTLTQTATAFETTQGEIALDTKCKQDIYEFAKINVKHSIWGLAHSERNYHLAMLLAAREKMLVDSEVIFIAAFMHDIGAIDPFRTKGIEHATRSVQVVEPMLKSCGLATNAQDKVREAILAHMYDAEVKPKYNEAKVFHDADTLDFLGDIGVVRIVALSDRHGWAPSLSGAIDTLRGWETELPGALVTTSAKSVAHTRIREMKTFMKHLKAYSFL